MQGDTGPQTSGLFPQIAQREREYEGIDRGDPNRAGSGFTAMQVNLSAADYSRTHHFTITADPNNQIRERDETNNQLAISVALPPRPTGTINVTCTSP